MSAVAVRLAHCCKRIILLLLLLLFAKDPPVCRNEWVYNTPNNQGLLGVPYPILLLTRPILAKFHIAIP